MQTCCHGDHYGPEHEAARRRRLIWMLVGTALMLNAYLGDHLFRTNPLVNDLAAAAGAIVLALPILWTALRGLLAGHTHVDELVAIAVLAAMAQGDFRTAGVVAFFMLVSLAIEDRTAAGAHQAIESLIRLTPTTARRLTKAGVEEEVAAHLLALGDRLRIRPGDTVPADGRVVAGQTTLNEASITGESLPRDKAAGDEVFAGTQNLTGVMEIEVTRVGTDTTIGRVRELILAAEKTRLPVMRIIDRYMQHYTPTVLLLAALVWFFTDDWSRVISLLVISCPCALILATPTAMVAALSAAARHGILVKNVADLEGAAGLDAVVFDKTGTLTTGELGVVKLSPCGEVKPKELLQAAAGAERYSKHPAARALLDLAARSGLALPEPEGFHEEAGQGVRATVEGARVLSGRATWLRQQGVTDAQLDTAQGEGFSVIHVARGDRYLGWIGLQDQVRPEAKAVIAELQALRVRRLAMVTGDRAAVAERVAAAIGCPEHVAECLPQRKVEFVNEVKRQGFRVAFVGDGVNDAPALAASDTGVAMGAAGSDAAIHSATVALMTSDLKRVPFLIRLSRGARAVVYQNLGVGVLFILGGFALSGLGLLNPIVATILHNAGSLIVVFNSARLVRSEVDEDAAAPAALP